MTRNLKLFTIVAVGSIVAYAVVFGLLFASHTKVDASMIFWFVLVSLSVGFFKEHYEDGDNSHQVRYDLHKRYNMIWIATIAVTSALWLLFWRANYLLLVGVEIIVLIMVGLYGIFANRRRIKGMKARDLFE